MSKIIKTIQWTAESRSLFRKCTLKKELGTPAPSGLRNFVEFFYCYQHLPVKTLAEFLEKMVRRNDFKNHDVTNIATLSEDSCLFSTSGSETEMLDIVLTYLDILCTGGRIPALWAYLDDEEKAIVHFVKSKGYYAELYCTSAEEFSVLHVLKKDDGVNRFIPVVFAEKLPEEAVVNTHLNGNFHLHDYLPREKFDLLSKGGRKRSGFQLPDKVGVSLLNKASGSDCWDTL